MLSTLPPSFVALNQNTENYESGVTRLIKCLIDNGRKGTFR
jgi:hypothetical protein